MPVAPCFDPTTGASGGATPGGSDPVTPPAAASESVAAGGSLAAVTFGAFTDPGGRISSYSATKTNVSGSATISGSGLGPYAIAGEADGEVLLIELDALDASANILATASYVGRVASSGTGSYTVLVDLDLTDLTTTAAVSGAATLAFDSSADTLDVNVTAFSGANGSWTPTNGVGLVGDGGTASGTLTLAFDIGDQLASWDYSVGKGQVYFVQLVCTGVSYPLSGSSDLFCGLNKTTTHNSSEARGFFITDDGDGTNEDIRLRTNTSNSAVLATTPIKTSRVFTFMLVSGEEVIVQDDSGTTLPTPAPSGATSYSVGADAIGMNPSTLKYDPLYAYVGLGDRTDLTITRLVVGKYE